MELRPISESWHSVESWLRDRERIRELAPPATSKEIARVEEHLGMNLHPDHTQLLQGHNGSGSFTLPPRYVVLSTSEVVDEWRIMTDVWAGHPHSPYRPHWVPFASDRAGGVLYLDGSQPRARIGAHDKEGASLLSPHSMWASLPSLMHHTADALESGHILDRYRRPGDDDFLLWEVFPDASSN
ncbi:SMI1/KNR4 family protein [Streptomyces sp. NPDC005808]|uniref:SMI1/KNR4 family protein n=1 Tax=Streptomyces sp. NPDC005808 TaxID=3364734 RepID=UPI00368B4D31